MRETVIEVNGLKKKYRLGTIGGRTLSRDIQTWWAKKQGKEDPNQVIGEEKKAENSDVFWALKGIDLKIYKGEAVGIIGANGAGKSTLLKIMSKVTAPTEGEIKIRGRIASMLEVGTGFHGELTGRENIYMNGAILGMSRHEVDEKIEQIIDFSECREFIDTPVKRYSSGMYVRLAFAVAAHLDAEILVMDEVLAVGDMKFQSKCLGKMGDVTQSEGRTVLYVSHNMSTIRQLCDRCIVLKQGEVIYDGDVETAIRLYLNRDLGEMTVYQSLEGISRPFPTDGVGFCLKSFEFLNKESPIFFTNEPIVYCLKWHSRDAISGLRAACSVRDIEEGRIVGMAQSDIFADTEAGQDGESCLQLDLSNLVEGKYALRLLIYVSNEFGNHIVYDRPRLDISFELINDPHRVSITWTKRGYGNVLLNTMHLANRENNTDGRK